MRPRRRRASAQQAAREQRGLGKEEQGYGKVLGRTLALEAAAQTLALVLAARRRSLPASCLVRWTMLWMRLASPVVGALIREGLVLVRQGAGVHF